jgi:hypothetical protein
MFIELGYTDIGYIYIGNFFPLVALFISMKCTSLSLLTNLGLKSTLSVISIANPAYFEGSLAW